MLIDSPTLVVAQIVQNELRRRKRAVAIVSRDPDSVVTKADNIGAAIAGDVCDESRMSLDSP